MRRQRGNSLADDVVLVAHNDQTINYCAVLCWSNKARQNQQIIIKTTQNDDPSKLK